MWYAWRPNKQGLLETQRERKRERERERETLEVGMKVHRTVPTQPDSSPPMLRPRRLAIHLATATTVNVSAGMLCYRLPGVRGLIND
ncbi:hypothetical protein BCV70DRAFT_110382 [Testicularia cyperi]|uniref:Uncharacterized protein n=1 Tax=Testicularia cyperi TaxID=1882483 RepID=A0A317XQQ4_9BASI|nr:hypothetical protein BCV70DRAFT_110382 [Testicularia cyperi]